eukprot:CAMPEP_0206139444 /NCGR_PEP_ID=MMETSP1473-20131121/6162_1 /ASSEMBLY_ACC=CAM_ASM_001109 /TAXON_ID=1461547 /ORGANISM="Stichococcus sp, Strain RCC1054" /LENGTH=345 /DNA_ID=CAMNT_0053533251 /DNA_START=152 /DNA_END=1186 /DNA_ORIENTATION=+
MGDEEYAPTLQSVLDQTDLKWIFVGGKGGVGKTTTSCCLSLLLSKVRKNVLIISTDPAHNLSDAFRQKFSADPTLVNGFSNLFAMEVDPNPKQSELAALNETSGGMLADIAGAIPGIDEAMSFAEVLKQVQSLDYDCVVFDTAPTGHTLRLLQFPATLDKALGKLDSMRAGLGGMLGQVAAMLGGPADGIDGIMGKLDQLKAVVQEVNNQFRNPQLTTFVCVCIPEFLSLYETERLVQELVKFEIDTQHIVINQIIWEAEASSSKLLRARVKMQQKYLTQYDDLYDDFHIVRLPLTEEEIRGVPALTDFSRHMLQPYTPAAVVSDSYRLQELEEECSQLRKRCAE